MSSTCAACQAGQPHQEILCVDAVLDRWLSSAEREGFEEEDDEMVAACMNRIFASPHTITAGAVAQRRAQLAAYRDQVQRLKAIPHIEQRSPEWYNLRKSLITASDFAQALGEGKFGTQKQFFQKKCGYEKDSFDYNSPPLKWGTMYEPCAGDIYCRRNNVTMHEFGILRHPTISHIGASPDGITSDGVMVEIKCPYKRKINGEVPTQYYFQIQGQLDVCGLQECDFLECEFTELCDMEAYAAFVNEKGVIIEYATDGSTAPEYVYSPIWCGAGTNMRLVDEWVNANIDDTKNNIVLHYWTLSLISVVRVYKNEEFIQHKLSMLADVWQKILDYQADEELYKREVGASRAATIAAANAMASGVAGAGGGGSMTLDLGAKGGKQMKTVVTGYAFD